MTDSKKIDRRTALKQMGAAVLSTAVASSGLLTLAACGEKERRRVILYFTGTGNCLYAARQLADAHTELLSIPQLVKTGRYHIEADEIGLVYPVYGHMPPVMVRQFMEKARLDAAYRFAVLTYGARICNGVELWDAISRRAGMPFHYIASLMMVDNWLPNFDMNEQQKMDKHIPENVARLRADIDNLRQWHEPVTEEQRQQHAGFIARSGIDPEKGFTMRSEQHFAVTEACVACGACTQVCPRGNYHMDARGVTTEGDCEFCFACIQNCPQKAIRLVDRGVFPFGHDLNPNARYRNEHVSLMDIKRANNQGI